MLVLSRLRKDERGVSLIEVLVSLSIGMVVLFAVLGLMTTMVRSSAESRGRTQAVREGRTTIDRVGQELRLASCPDWGNAILSGTDNSVSYYVTRPLANFRVDPVVERHTLTFDPSAGTLRLTVQTPTNTTTIPPVWNSAPARQSVIGSRVARVGTTPFFQYLGYNAPTAPATSPIAAPVAAENLSKVGQVLVTFTALPDFGNTARGSTFESTIVLRTDDPTDQDNTPQC
jgi:type II secretory pathway pseudopilin PulG